MEGVTEPSESPHPLDQYKIPIPHDSFYYIPNFLSASEASALLSKIPPQRWTQLSRRRLQAHPSTLLKGNTLIASPLPPWLATSPPIIQRFNALSVFSDTKHQSPNHVLINEYKPGEGIMPHEDGGAYSRVVATISLGASIVLDVYDKDDLRVPKWRILQEPGSLLVTMGKAYEDLIHGIAEVENDENLNAEGIVNWRLLGDKAAFESGSQQREVRVSLTYRDVLKVSKIGMSILGRK